MVESSTVNYRTYDTRSSKTGGTVELLVGPGGGGTYETKVQELTGAYYLEPGKGAGLVAGRAPQTFAGSDRA